MYGKLWKRSVPLGLKRGKRIYNPSLTKRGMGGRRTVITGVSKENVQVKQIR